ncbi:uncharacterized protein PAC_15905 [Phialocephala subalpina]|uniref:2EXR domain-containing protein n=1 Tax=Phialocephala subalpina TaxID=576137 RepID=A0A1L7XLS6_9HELO|nr:uncharacterized protein PAC_15905 [Phialocephala subalpina]
MYSSHHNHTSSFDNTPTHYLSNTTNPNESSQPKRKRRSAALPPKLTEFHPFPDLPIELRSIIWKEACFVSRDVDIWMRYQGEVRLDQIPEAEGLEVFLPHPYHSRSQAPSILQVDQESRAEGLRWYRLEFGTNMRIGGLSYVLPPKIYINWEVDRLCLMDASCISRTWAFRHDEVSFSDICRQNGLKVLALNLCDGPNIWGLASTNKIATALRNMRLKDLVLFQHGSYRHHPRFTLEPFRKVKRDGTLTKEKAPNTHEVVKRTRDEIVSVWDEIEADKAAADQGIVDEGEAGLLPRAKITLM